MDRNSPTSELETGAEAFWCPNPYPNPEDFSHRFMRDLIAYCRKELNGLVPIPQVTIELVGTAEQFYQSEPQWQVDFHRLQFTDPVEHGRYRDYLLKLVGLSREIPEVWLQVFTNRLLLIFNPFLRALPLFAFSTKISADIDCEGPTAKVIDIIDDAGEVVGAMIAHAFIKFHHESKVIDALKAHFIELGDKVARGGPAIMPDEYQGSPREIVSRYIGDATTALGSLFYIDVPLPEEPVVEQPQEEPPGEPVITERTWFQHCLLLAQTGAGKTNAIRWRIAQLLPGVAAGKASLIVMEPKGDLIDELLHAATLWPIRDRVVILDPADSSVSVNLFEPPVDNSPVALNETIDRVSRVLNTITLDMTALQKQALTLAMRAMYAMGNPSMRSLMTILRRGKMALDLSALPLPVANFFEDDFRETDGRLIIQRLNGLLSNPIFEALFGREQTTFDMLEAINASTLIVINSGRAPEIYGRFWIEELDRCLRPRMAMPEHRRTPTYFILDEAPVYVADDPHFARMLDMARGARIGLLVAAQHLEQDFSAHVRNSLLTNTALKFVARTSGDIFNLCRSMGMTEPNFLGTIPRYHFAFFGPDMTEAALVKLPLVEFNQQMTAAQYGDLRRLNRERYALQTARPERNATEQIAALSPLAAILEARRKLEEGVRMAALALSLPDYTSDMTMLSMIKALEDHEIIDGHARDRLHELRRFGNNAAHNTDATDLTKEAALEFTQMVDHVLRLFQTHPAHQAPAPKPGSQHQTDFDTDWQEH